MKTPDNDSAQVKVPPPLAVLLFLLLSLGLNYFHPAAFIDGCTRWIGGGFLVFLGAAIIIYCAFIFKKSKTNIEPWKPTRVLTSRGPYHFSRNPIYLSFLIIGIGIVFLVNNWIAVLFLIPLFIFLSRYVIQKEETYLASKFGKEYEDYCLKTRRWI